MTRILRGVGCKVSAWEQWGPAPGKRRPAELAIAHRLEAATTARLSERQTRSRSPRAGRAGGGDRGARPMAAGGGGWGGIMADVPVFEVPDDNDNLGCVTFAVSRGAFFRLVVFYL